MKWYKAYQVIPLQSGIEILISDGIGFDLGYWYRDYKNIFFLSHRFVECKSCQSHNIEMPDINMIYWTFIELPDIPKRYRNVTSALKLKVLKRDKFKCVSCQKTPATDSNVELHVDHIIPFSKGGLDKLSNLQVLCKDCNNKKWNK